MMISSYLLSWFSTKLVQGSVRSEWRTELILSIEKIARMRDISLLRGAQGFLTLVTGVCAVFLFSTMSAEHMDEMTITVVGISGYVASFGVVILEVQRRISTESESEGAIGLAMV
ncbi:hypothetical protein TrLO_g9234 [Triparma laevis f. longispina]|uniref:Uncharacterized protein n=1 Tax=Triparma laevis f. longispina TaxID=1714387 RepID=A0A9W7CH78_9STRA|nr:hypothetical protein TrLO_g9234 [Triparma laevis f. longispina]